MARSAKCGNTRRQITSNIIEITIRRISRERAARINLAARSDHVLPKFYKYGYENINGKEHFDVDKHGLNAAINYDSRFDSEEIYVNGAKGVYFSAENGDKAIVFNNGEYVYTISGDIEKEELIKIAQNVK